MPVEYFDIVQLMTRIKSSDRGNGYDWQNHDNKEDWDQYAERLEHFFAANGITEAGKKRSVFLTVTDTKVYKQLQI